MAMHPSRQAYVEEDQEMTYDLTNVPTDTDYHLPAGSGESSKVSEVLAEMSRKREAAAIAVPTDDGHVRRKLREMNEPMTLFGERPEDRRDRLRKLMYVQQQGANGDVDMDEADEEADDSNQEFYTTGTRELLEARKAMAHFSLPRARRRVEYQKLESGIPLKKHVDHRNVVRERLGGFELFGSQIAGDRPVSMARFAPSGDMVAAGNWGGTIRLLDVPNLDEKMVLRGHTSQVSGISWFPGATLADSITSKDSLNLASGGGEGHVNLWSLTQDTPMATLEGHSGRVCRVEFHPSGRFIASASYDTTWRLWDVETTTELLLQEGHSREAFAIAFNQDGSLVATGGLDSIACLWDVRTGRRVLTLESHIAPLYALDWSVDGYRIMTGSGDGFAKCWDIRMMRETASIGAHRGGVTDLRWYKGLDGPVNWNPEDSMSDELSPRKAGSFFVSSGFDKNVNIFSSDDWVLCKSLTGHSGNVLSVDTTSDAKWIVSSGYDRTVKLWARDDMEGL
ncbi:hypothetical protein KVT40_004409 [Elsinoe batatas]|uniref:Pre-mRNA processing factor 4 (PRP4)-like domain-containing protein n=1 Tax=Elsinoe batatas TaxID=2601811 RepID=A0A8K0L6D7_9PEZI|nr:hypothetical protein KVT40_004409 [Elsinoe batatas]